MTQLEDLLKIKEIVIKDCLDPALSRENVLRKYRISTRALYDFMRINNINWVSKPHDGSNQFTSNPIRKIIENRIEIKNDSHEGLIYNSHIDFLNKNGVYRIVSASGGVYIGAASCTFRKRFNEHRNMLIKDKHHCIGLQRSYHNIPKASFEIIEVIKTQSNEYDYIYEREIYYWNFYNNANYKIYNGKPNGLSLSHTLETRKKISETKKLKFTDDEINIIYNLYVVQGKSKYEIGRKILHVSDRRLNNLIEEMAWKQ